MGVNRFQRGPPDIFAAVQQGVDFSREVLERAQCLRGVEVIVHCGDELRF